MAEIFSTGDVQVSATALQTAYAYGVLVLFDGTKPATANDSEGSAHVLAVITNNAGAFSGGTTTNGLTFGTPVAGVLSKTSGQTWKGLGTAAASTGTTATWFRFYANAYTTGASTSAVRFDGTVSTSSTAELQLTNTTIVEDVPVEISTFTRTVKRSA